MQFPLCKLAAYCGLPLSLANLVRVWPQSQGSTGVFLQITAIVVYCVLVFLLPSIWSVNPCLLRNIGYRVTTSLSMRTVKTPTVFIVDHHLLTEDVIIMCTEIVHSALPVVLVGRRYSKFSTLCKLLPLFPQYKLLEAAGSSRNNIVTDSVTSLRTGFHVVIFSRRDSRSTGIYHMLRQTKAPAVLVRHTCNLTCDTTAGFQNSDRFEHRHFEIAYEEFDYDCATTPEDFMQTLSRQLYQY